MYFLRDCLYLFVLFSSQKDKSNAGYVNLLLYTFISIIVKYDFLRCLTNEYKSNIYLYICKKSGLKITNTKYRFNKIFMVIQSIGSQDLLVIQIFRNNLKGLSVVTKDALQNEC